MKSPANDDGLDDLPTMEEIEETMKAAMTLLAGKSPMLQGAVLADLTAMFFAGQHPSIREVTMHVWIETMQKLIKPNEEVLLHHQGTPPGWSSN